MSILLIDKPKGITSFDVIRCLRREYQARGEKAPKMGHAGTLDPLASGLMVIGVGPGTKELAQLVKLDKTYEAEIILGESRTTGDLEGEIIEECPVKIDDLSEEVITSTLQTMVGFLELPVPAYSAIKQGGEALYKKVRRGELVKPPVKKMKVIRAQLQETDNFQLTESYRVVVRVEFEVGSGTYIRSLVEELGRRLGYPATLGNLRRTRVGDFKIEGARKICRYPIN